MWATILELSSPPARSAGGGVRSTLLCSEKVYDKNSRQGKTSNWCVNVNVKSKADGKSSTRLPPGRVAELPKLHKHVQSNKNHLRWWSLLSVTAQNALARRWWMTRRSLSNLETTSSYFGQTSWDTTSLTDLQGAKMRLCSGFTRETRTRLGQPCMERSHGRQRKALHAHTHKVQGPSSRKAAPRKQKTNHISTIS